MNIFSATLAASVLALVVTLTPFAPAYAGNDEAMDRSSMFADLDLPVYAWCKNIEKPRAIVLCFHGAVLHGRSFRTLATALAERNCLAVSMDLRGYGEWCYGRPPKSATIRYTESISDIRRVLERLRESYPGTPIYCLGESLGANMSLLIGARMPNLVDGVIAVSPVASMRRISSRVCISPGWASRCAIHVLTLHKIDLKYYLARTLSNRKEIIAEHFADPLSRDRQSIVELCRTLHVSRQAARAAKELPATTQVLFMTGQEDKIVPPKAIRRLFRNLPCRDKTLALEPKSGHLMVESAYIQPVTVKIISRWIDERTKPALALQM